jgi:hypothetical protein
MPGFIGRPWAETKQEKLFKTSRVATGADNPALEKIILSIHDMFTNHQEILG